MDEKPAALQTLQCKARTIKGSRCKNPVKEGHEFCARHSISRTTKARWFENTWYQLLLLLLAVGAILVTVRACKLGATAEKQTEGLRMENTELGLLTNSLKRQEATAQDIHEVRELLAMALAQDEKARKVTELDEVRYPGFALNMLLRLNQPVQGRSSFIFEAGQNPNHNAISLYVEADGNLCFQVIGKATKAITLRVPPGLGTFSFGSWLYLACEYGHTGDSVFLQMIIDGRQVAIERRSKPYPFDTDRSDCVLGADLNRTNAGVFDVMEIAVYSQTLARSNREDMLRYLNSQLTQSKGFVSFSGNQWLENRSGTFLQGLNLQTIR
jgi:hypothetical protein